MPAKQTLIHSSKTNRNTKPSARNKSLLFMVPKRTDDVEIIGFLLMNLALLAILAFLYCPKAAALCLAAMDEAEERAARTAEEMPELHGSVQLEGIHHISPQGCTARLSYACEETAREAVTKQLLAFVAQRVQQGMEKASRPVSNDE